MTIDPVSTANPGWDDFIVAYNQFCMDRNGRGLLNQTPGLTAACCRSFAATGETLKAARAQFDPDNRLLNDYFRQLLA